MPEKRTEQWIGGIGVYFQRIEVIQGIQHRRRYPSLVLVRDWEFAG